jgi:hypothetical protein
MKTIALATAAILAALTTAHAGFKNIPPPPIDNGTALECVPLRSTEHGPDRDPVYKTSVSLTLENGSTPTDISVVHTTVSGMNYNRSEQYHDGNIWQMPHKTQWFWKGYRGNLTMVGEIMRSTRYEWWYTEKIFDPSGRLDFAMEERCHLDAGNDGYVEHDELNEQRSNPPSMRDAPRWLHR